MKSQQSFEWQFGGWPGVPSWLGWTLLVVLAVTGAALAVWLYRDTLQALRPRQRVIFILLRTGFFLALLLCLAGPSRLTRTYDAGDEARPLAIVVDRSASMTVPDASGLSRLTAAVRTWKQSEAAAIHKFSGLRFFHFSGALNPDADLQHAVDAVDPGKETALFASLDQALQTAPAGGYGAIVCLTDGLDTTQAVSDQMAARAIQSRTPLSFVVGENHQTAPDNLVLRETVTPDHVLRKAEFEATALVEAHCSRARDVSLTLAQDGQPPTQTTLHLRAGVNLVPWSVPIRSDEPGLIHLNWRLGDGAEQESAAATVPVLAKNQVSILFYQGSLDWGFRFIATALQRDASFQVTGLFNPDLNLTNPAAPAPQPNAAILSAFPETVAALLPFQIVVLADTWADQMSEAQQKALSDYVKQGGGLLFLVSDTKMARTFSGTALEAMLPVVFDPPSAPGNAEDTLEEFQNRMHSVGGVNMDSETEFAGDSPVQPPSEPLKAFALSPQTSRKRIAQLFSAAPGVSAAEVPRFSTYAHAAALKAGAEALAVHPEDKTPTNEPRVLLATQRFGQGQVTALLTDALWRWKLSLPSATHVPETFWQQVFAALAGPGGSLNFSKQPYSASLGDHAQFRIEGGNGLSGPTVSALAPTGSAAPLVLPLQPGTHPGEWSFQLTPDQPGKWRIQARSAAGAEIETLLRVGAVARTSELSGLPPDADGLRKLAQLTGGYLLNDGTPESWAGQTAAPELTVISEHVHPLWNTWFVLLAALTLYAVELIWRRHAKLL